MPGLMLKPGRTRLPGQRSLINLLLVPGLGVVMTIPNLMSTPVIIDKPEAIPISIPRRGSSLVIIRVLWLTGPTPAALVLPGRGDGGIIPALV